MLLGGRAGHRHEPVGVVGGPLGQRPLLHAVGDRVHDRRVERLVAVDRLAAACGRSAWPGTCAGRGRRRRTGRRCPHPRSRGSPGSWRPGARRSPRWRSFERSWVSCLCVRLRRRGPSVGPRSPAPDPTTSIRPTRGRADGTSGSAAEPPSVTIAAARLRFSTEPRPATLRLPDDAAAPRPSGAAAGGDQLVEQAPELALDVHVAVRAPDDPQPAVGRQPRPDAAARPVEGDRDPGDQQRRRPARSGPGPGRAWRSAACTRRRRGARC